SPDPGKGDPQSDPDRRHGSLDRDHAAVRLFDRLTTDRRLRAALAQALHGIFRGKKSRRRGRGNGAPPEAHQPQLSRASGRTVEVKRDCHGTTIDRLEASVASIARPAGADRAVSVRQYLVEEV